MEPVSYVKFLVALVFVLSLMGGLAYVLKRFGIGQGMAPVSGKRRLRVVEVLPLDAKRKLMMIERDDVQHLVILSPAGETVLETNIKPRPHENTSGTSG